MVSRGFFPLASLTAAQPAIPKVNRENEGTLFHKCVMLVAWFKRLRLKNKITLQESPFRSRLTMTNMQWWLLSQSIIDSIFPCPSLSLRPEVLWTLDESNRYLRVICIRILVGFRKGFQAKKTFICHWLASWEFWPHPIHTPQNKKAMKLKGLPLCHILIKGTCQPVKLQPVSAHQLVGFFKSEFRLQKTNDSEHITPWLQALYIINQTHKTSTWRPVSSSYSSSINSPKLAILWAFSAIPLFAIL